MIQDVGVASQKERPEYFALIFSAIFNVRLPHCGVRRLLLTQPGGRKKEEVKDTSLHFDSSVRKLYIPQLLISHWPEFRHMAMNSCKEDWEM